LLSAANDCLGVIITPDRLPANGSWQGIAGVPGGIPDRTNIFVNVLTTTNVYYQCVADGTTDNLTPIVNAINDCPSNEVVYLPSGTYYVSGPIRIETGGYFTLRGDGIGKTIITGGDGNGLLSFGNPPYGNNGVAAGGWASATPITAGATKGSTSITVASTASLAVGQMMWLEQTNDGIVAFGYGANGLMNNDDRLRDNTHVVNCRAMVTKIRGNIVFFTPALTFDFNNNLSPQAVGFGPTTIQWAGIEDMTLQGSTNGPGVYWDGAYACWMKDVELTAWGTFGFWLQWAANMEVRECYIHEPFDYYRSYGYPMQFDAVNNSLIEDNIFWHYQAGLFIQGGCSGNVIGYNCFFQQYDVYPQGVQFMLGSLYGHTPYPQCNLWEGNYANEFKMDFYYGPSDTSTVLRNYLTGTDPDITQNRICVSLDAHQWSNNVVGNILGLVGSNAPLYVALPDTNIVWANTAPLTWLYDPGTENFPYDVSNVIYRLGYPQSGNNYSDGIYYDGGTNDLGGIDARVRSSTIIHGNWDSASQSITWSPNISDTNIPNSYYLSGKPSWWGNTPWPPFDPNNPTAASITNIPAGYRFVFQPYPVKTVGTIGTSVTNPPTLLISLANTNSAVVAWPGYILQQNSSLDANTWVNVTNAIAIVGNQYECDISLPVSQQYFRLQSSGSTPSLQTNLTSANTLALTWSGYLLQQNSNLTTGNWVNATNAISTSGNNYQVTTPLAGQQYYYRLKFY
jgi:hypothetical protein